MIDREQFIIDRKKGLGGSDIAAIMGISPWKTPMDVYLEKTTEVQDIDNEALKRGRRAENYVLDTYEEMSGNKIIRNIDTIEDKKYPFLFANIDAKAAEDNIIVEAKTTSDFLSNWGGLPEYYKTQVAHYAHITNADRVHIPVLFSGWQYRCFIYERDIDFENQIKTRAIWFWTNHVKKKIPPKATCPEDTAKLYPNSNGRAIKADKCAIDAIKDLKNLKDDIKVKQDQYKQVTKNIQEYMQDNEILNLPESEDIIVATWRNQISTRFDNEGFKADYPELYNQYKKEVASRVFRIR